MIRHTLALEYCLEPGWMAPFVKGLLRGEAMARRCEDCGIKSFPPHRTCACGGSGAVWVSLPGTATIQFRATGSDGDFALVQFDGADTSSVVSLQGIAEGQTNGRISAPDDAVPKLVLGPIEENSR